LVLHWSFSSGVGVRFAQSSSQWEARADEEISQTLLNNYKQGNLDYKYTPVTLLSQRKLASTARNTLFAF
jgi:hypothetical protein